MSDILGHLALRQDERVGLGRGGDDVELVLRIELAQGFHRDVDCRCDLFEVHQAVDANRVDRQRNGGRFGLDAVVAVVGIGVGGADERRNVAAGLARQKVVDVPERTALSARTSQRLVDVAGAAVVGRDGQRPLLVDAVEVFQIAAGGLGRKDGVAALVDQRIDFEPVAASGGGHELPQPGGSGVGNGCGRKSRFDDGQGAQFDGQPFLDEFVLDEREIVLRHAEDAADGRTSGCDVAVDVAPHDAVVGELDGRCEGPQASGVDRIGDAAFGGERIDQHIGVEEFAERLAALPFAPFGHERIDLLGGELRNHAGGFGLRGAVGRGFGGLGSALGLYGFFELPFLGSGLGLGGLRSRAEVARLTVEGGGLCGTQAEQQQYGQSFHDQNLRLMLNPKTGRLPPAPGT